MVKGDAAGTHDEQVATSLARLPLGVRPFVSPHFC